MSFTSSKMKPHLTDFRFSTPFNRLTYLGMWPPEMLWDSKKKKIFLVYRLFCASALTAAILVQLTDLYFVMGNFRKVTYNFCTSIFVFGLPIKIFLFHIRRDQLKELRWGLWRDSTKLNSPEDLATLDAAYGQLKGVQRLFYASFMVFLPVWIVSSYFSYLWGPRQLAFSGYLPLKDPLDDRYYVPALTCQAISGFYVVFLVIEVELAMFSIFLQIEAHYQILTRNLLKLNEIYSDDSENGTDFLKESSRKEVNPCLRKESARTLVKALIIRQQEILEYLKIVEVIFSPCMLLKLLFGSSLIVMNGVELSLFLHEMSVKLFFQSGYMILIVLDIFLVCYHGTRLSTESLNVASAAYSTVWYKMEPEIRRSLCLIMVRSQNPPRITAGKFFVVNLNTYLHMMQDIYRWLMLFRQLGSK